MKFYGAIQCPTDLETSVIGMSSVVALTKNMTLLELAKSSGSSVRLGGGSGGAGGGAGQLASLSLWVQPEKLELGDKIGEGNFGEVREAWLDDAGHRCKVAVKIYGTNICRAMAELHSRGILMRDLKPANFLVDDYDTAVVADFGLSKLLKESATSTLVSGKIAGTPCYMPPEAWGAGDSLLHPTSDVWSFACSVIDMFTGKPPFHSARSIFEVQKRVVLDRERPQVPAGLPTEVEECLRKCFAYDAKDRPNFDTLLDVFQRNPIAPAQRNPMEPVQRTWGADNGESSAIPRRLSSPLRRLSSPPQSESPRRLSTPPHIETTRRFSSPPRPEPPRQRSSPPRSDPPRQFLSPAQYEFAPSRETADQSAPPQRFLPNSWVRVKKSVSNPKFGWISRDRSALMHDSIGFLKDVDSEGTASVQYCFSDEPMVFSVEELEVVPSLQEGDTVRVKGSVVQPRFGWGEVRRNMIGNVVSIDMDKAMVEIDFPDYTTGWVADPSEIERMSRPFRRGDWARIRASVLRARRRDSGLQEITESSLAIVKDVLDGGKVKLDFCFMSNYTILDQWNAELLDFPPFVLDDQVSLKRSVRAPRYEWGGEGHCSVGTVAEICDDGLIKVQFPDRGSLCTADPGELMVIQPAQGFRRSPRTGIR
ncbi:hypothetical protein CBR_g22351 [Chara braunii]|uniref:Protein kinase domain-containing protein n=1 Tax=Chara braunii TaxID=69332 RepID=A0A388JUR7_CHABU|nr:hypothetical protein CBR_g22351 [Chara braunii]|eukprot:GBG61554.1 hypothetical protein CBR_g22351 [Chara braunii]